MGTFFGDAWNAIKKGASDTVHEVGRDIDRIAGKNEKPNPGAFTNMPTNTNSPYTTTNAPGGGSNSPIPLGGSSPYAGAPSGFNQQQFENAVRTNPDLAGVWQTIQGLGGDVWGVISNFLPKNADGSIDWGKVGGDVLGWVKNNAQTIIQGAAAVANYQRQQKADEYAKQGLELSKQRFAENEPLRTAGRAGMLDPTKNAPDLSNLKHIAGAGSGNPFAGAPLSLSTQNVPPISLTPRAPVTPQVPHPTPIPATPPLSLQGAPSSPPGSTLQPVSTMPVAPGTPPVDPNAPIPLRTAPARPKVPPVPGVPSPLSLLNQQQPTY